MATTRASSAGSGAVTGATVGSLGGPLGATAGAGVGALVGALLGGEKKNKLSQSQLSQLRGGINGGGLFSRLFDENRQVKVSSTPERQALIDAISSRLEQTGQGFSGLRGQVEPGFGRLSTLRQGALDDVLGGLGLRAEAAKANIEAAQRGAIGDLRSNLARRRVAGSSFASNQEAAIRDQFGRAQADVEADAALREAEARTAFSDRSAAAFLDEFKLSLGLFEKEQGAYNAALHTRLTELNVQADLATTILTSSQGGVAAAQTAAQQAANAMFGDILGAGATTATIGGYLLGETLFPPNTSRSLTNSPTGGRV